MSHYEGDRWVREWGQVTTSESRPSLTCPYCRGPAPLVTGREVYPHRPDLFEKPFYACLPCDAYVGCHPGTTNALGRLADKRLRTMKSRVHAAFDPIWKTGKLPRSSAYARLADAMGIPVSECHVGMFDVVRCDTALRVLARWGGNPPARGVDVAKPSAPPGTTEETIKGVRVHSRVIGETAGKDLPW